MASSKGYLEFVMDQLGAVADDLPEPKKKKRPGIRGEDR